MESEIQEKIVKPDPTKLLEIADIKTPLVGFYDVPDLKPFEPFTQPTRCFFSSYADWLKGYSTSVTVGKSSCKGGGYWVGGVMPDWAVKSSGPDLSPRESFAQGLNRREGFKSSDRLLCQWLENLPPYRIKNGHVVIGPLKQGYYDYLKTITFYVNPDQLSLLIHGAEYDNASITNNPIMTAFGSGCGQMAALLGDLDTDVPKAAVGATDMAMREHLPPDILAFTVNKPMYEQLCALDESSFLYKHFWKRLKKTRANMALESRGTIVAAYMEEARG